MLGDAALDLLLGSRCVGCARPGRLLCASCADTLPAGAQEAGPSPAPPGLAPVRAAAPYEGLVRELVLGHKERRLLALRTVLGRLLAGAVIEVLGTGPGAVVLVPVPSRGASVRERGHDPTRAMTAAAAAEVRIRGVEAVSVPLLRLRPGVVDQAGLDASARQANLAWSMAGRTRTLRRLARRTPAARLVVCDDVLTTGATAREAQRALEGLGLTVSGVAVVAATQRRVTHRESSGQRLSSDRVTD